MNPSVWSKSLSAGVRTPWVQQTVVFGRTAVTSRFAKPKDKKLRVKTFKIGKFSALSEPTEEDLMRSEKPLDKITSFDDLRVFPTVRMALVGSLEKSYAHTPNPRQIAPTPVQIAAIRKINQVRKVKQTKRTKSQEGQEIYSELVKNNLSHKLKVFTVAAETGSGKTWAYLAPLLSKLKEDDLELFRTDARLYEDAKTSQVVRSVILLPTHELVNQVYSTLMDANSTPVDTANISAKMLKDAADKAFFELPEQSGCLGLNILKWDAGEPASVYFKALRKRVDVLVTTPTKLQSLGKQETEVNPYRHLYNVQYAVADEADTLFDPSWLNDTTAILEKFSKCKDLILCSATIPKRFKKNVDELFDGQTIDVITPSLHKFPARTSIVILDAEQSPYNGSKTRCLAQALYFIRKNNKENNDNRVLVFVNHKKDVQPLVEVLIGKYKQDPATIIGLTGNDQPKDRADKLKVFLKKQEDSGSNSPHILVTTDLYARGIDFVGIKSIILMDLPNNSVDLMHRVGRTARMGRAGKAYVIVDRKTGKSWVKALPKVAQENVRLG